MSFIKVVECPRDAMQGFKTWIPSEDKIDYIQSILSVGFDVVDFGSFVSHRAVPQMRDTHYVLDNLDLSKTKSKLLSIVANLRGAKEACGFPQIYYFGYPFSISENFQMRNTNKTIAESYDNLMEIKKITDSVGKELVVYLSMCFGNPYGEIWDLDKIDKWISKLVSSGIKIISLSDTIGSATPESIQRVYKFISLKYPNTEFGLHLHTNPKFSREKIDTSIESGCLRLDGAIPVSYTHLTLPPPPYV